MMNIQEEYKDKLINTRVFKYKGVVHIVNEFTENIKGFYGCYGKRGNLKVCIINANLCPTEKRRALHRLIKERHLVKF